MNIANEHNTELLKIIARRHGKRLTQSQIRAGSRFLRDGVLARRLFTTAPIIPMTTSEMLSASGELLHDCFELAMAVPQTKRQAPTRALLAVGLSDSGHIHTHIVVDSDLDCLVMDAATIGSGLVASYDKRVGGKVTPTIVDSVRVLGYLFRQSYSDDAAAPQSRKIGHWTPSVRGSMRSNARGNLSRQLEWLQNRRASSSRFKYVRVPSQVTNQEIVEIARTAADFSNQKALNHSTC